MAQEIGVIPMKKRGFTLIELLVVVVIIGILLGLLSSALAFAVRNARRTRATAEGKALAAAMRAFRHEYGKWPCSETDPPSSGEPFRYATDNYKEVVQRLVAYRDSGTLIHHGDNKNRVTFLRPSECFTKDADGENIVNLYRALKYDEGEPNTQGIVDPWGLPYRIEIDLANDEAYVTCDSLQQSWRGGVGVAYRREP